eukprot:TRINITY_DN41857_c0_g1_i1.p2 TRINITY_DN41857_c0_g1~~TRINITY_DN41857_c0_g1_i1.p2  ORF type:complete len:104 (-),score=40.70 TRINITY_DN41857_c0_g1_i1:131-442(-)
MLRSLVGSEMCIRDSPHIAEEAVNEEVEEPTHNNIDEEAEEREHVPDEEVEELVPPQVRDEEMEEASVQHDGNALLLFSDADRDVSLLPVSYTHLTLPTKRIV